MQILLTDGMAAFSSADFLLLVSPASSSDVDIDDMTSSTLSLSFPSLEMHSHNEKRTGDVVLAHLTRADERMA